MKLCCYNHAAKMLQFGYEISCVHSSPSQMVGKLQAPRLRRYDDIIRHAASPGQMQVFVATPCFQRAKTLKAKAAVFGFQTGQWFEPLSRRVDSPIAL